MIQVKNYQLLKVTSNKILKEYAMKSKRLNRLNQFLLKIVKM